ncbi:hypothetical protein GW17_00051744 [Ensete ventricosum]|nr:hypothetical protein GW17_00051744 [Ensete ventricosum]
MGELEGAVADADGRGEVMVINSADLGGVRLPRRIAPHQLGSCLSSQRRQRRTARVVISEPGFGVRASKQVEGGRADGGSPDGLELQPLALLVGDGGEGGTLAVLDGGGGGGALLLEGVELVDGLRLHRRGAVVVADAVVAVPILPVLGLLEADAAAGLDRWQPSARRHDRRHTPIGEAELCLPPLHRCATDSLVLCLPGDVAVVLLEGGRGVFPHGTRHTRPPMMRQWTASDGSEGRASTVVVDKNPVTDWRSRFVYQIVSGYSIKSRKVTTGFKLLSYLVAVIVIQKEKGEGRCARQVVVEGAHVNLSTTSRPNK